MAVIFMIYTIKKTIFSIIDFTLFKGCLAPSSHTTFVWTYFWFNLAKMIKG